jgi:class I fructose-bisphosphate aldolase
MVTILWCYARNNAFVKVDYNSAADITGQANYLGVSLQADIIKQNHQQITVDLQQLNLQKLIQKCILNYPATTIDLCRYQVMNCYAGRISMLNSGGVSRNERL